MVYTNYIVIWGMVYYLLYLHYEEIKTQPGYTWVLAKLAWESVESRIFNAVSCDFYCDLVIDLPTIKHARERLGILSAGMSLPNAVSSVSQSIRIIRIIQ